MSRLRLLFVVSLFLLPLHSVILGQEKCDKKTEETEDPADLKNIAKCAIKSWRQSAGKKGQTTKVQPVAIVISSRRNRKLRDLVDSAVLIREQDKVKKVASGEIKPSAELSLESNTAVKRVPFEIIETPPSFPDCGSNTSKKCFEDQIKKHIKKNFNYPTLALLKGIEGRVITQFVINEQGAIEDVQLRARKEHYLLKREAKRLIDGLPKLVSGKIKGVPVKTKYGFPLTFKIPDNDERLKKEVIITDALSFAEVDEIPQFRNCVDSSDKLECFSDEMGKHIQENFFYPEEAIVNKVEGRIFIQFVIDKGGSVTNIKTLGSNNSILLEEAAYDLVRQLPKFKPGKHKGKVANVKYSIPIHFKLD